MRIDSTTAQYIGMGIKAGLEKLSLAVLVLNRVGISCIRKTLQPQDTGITVTTRATIVGRVVAAVGQGVIDAKLVPGFNNLSFGHLHQWRMDSQLLCTLDPCFGRKIRQLLVGVNVRWSTIRVATVIKDVYTNKNIFGA